MIEALRSNDGGLTCDEVRDLAAGYVLDALDPDEFDEVYAHLRGCAEPHPEFAELASVVPALVASVPIVEPPASLRDRLMAAAAADLEERRAAARPVSPVIPVSPVTTSSPVSTSTSVRPVTELPRRATRPGVGTWALRIAAVLAIALLGGWNVLLQGQLSSARSYEQSVAAVLDVAAQDGALTAILTPAGPAGSSGLAAVSPSGDVTIAMRSLTPTAGSQVYEAWVIGGDGTPVALGSFQVGQTGTASFTGDGLPTEPGIVLALTLEPGPGATAPSSDPVAVGTATAAG